MPSRPRVHHGTSTSPHQSSNAVNDVVNALQRKLTSNHIETVPAPKPSRRPSFSMDSIIHPKSSAKKHDEQKERESRTQKRLSLSLPTGGKSKDRASGPSPRVGPLKPGKFDMVIESPPLVFIGTIANSSGALLSGRLKLQIDDPTGEIQLNTFTMICRAMTTTKKPVSKECKDCSEKHDDLKTWTFLSGPKTYYKSIDNQMPFSFLFPGHLPATSHSQLGSITYALFVTATTSHGEKIDYVHPLTIARAIPQGPDKSSIRIFPPTNLTGRVTLPPVIHPIGTFPVSFTLSGVAENKITSQTRWRLRKMMWRIEEISKVVSAPCVRHQNKVTEGKAVQHQETKILGNDEMKSGWKSDFDTIGGEIMLEFEASVATKSGHKATCDVDSNSGLEVRHSLIVELIVAEEFSPTKNPSMITPTGAARVLRMQFNLVVTERMGMGISWDDEMPPMYEDVPDSPPGYGSADKNDGAWGGAIMEDYEGPELEYVELERMHSENPNDPPRYRDRGVDENNVNTVLPMRPRAAPRTASSEQGPSNVRRRVGGWTEDELATEPPQYALRRRESGGEQVQEEVDYGEGIAGNAPPTR